MSPSHALDLSRSVWRTGQTAKVSDLFFAVPMVRGEPVLGVTASGSDEITVQIQRAANTLTQGAYYDLSSASVQDVQTPSAAPEVISLRRVGGRVRILRIDKYATAKNSAQSYSSNELQVASLAVLEYVDNQLIQGNAFIGNAIQGLSAMCAAYSRAGTITDPDIAAREIIAAVMCRGESGAGDGIDCFFAGRSMVRTLMSTAAGQRGTSGWRRDARTGRLVYHYQGLPVYRVDNTDSETGKLWGANLSSCGLNIVHAYGSSDSFGLVAEETPVTSATGAREVTVHGAFALVAWEQTAIFEVNGITLAT
ncbi:MAG: hypothetical protein JNK05_13680 [Myxococcales bacterium]|nr:hypothetical protein [Myxococcales bacterium]